MSRKSSLNSGLSAYTQGTSVINHVQLIKRSFGNRQDVHTGQMQIAAFSLGISHTILHLEHLHAPHQMHPDHSPDCYERSFVAGPVSAVSTLSICSSSWKIHTKVDPI